jgi:predicted transcriptional regulator
MFRERFRLRHDTQPARPDDVIGPLEARVIERLWASPGPSTVRDLQPDFPNTAYTTLMTTLDRLHRKGLLERSKIGRAFHYRPRYSREELASEVARRSFERLLGSGAAGLRPILSTLVDTVSQRDAEALDELERLVHERRARERGEEDPS